MFCDTPKRNGLSGAREDSQSGGGNDPGGYGGHTDSEPGRGSGGHDGGDRTGNMSYQQAVAAANARLAAEAKAKADAAAAAKAAADAQAKAAAEAKAKADAIAAQERTETAKREAARKEFEAGVKEGRYSDIESGKEHVGYDPNEEGFFEKYVLPVFKRLAFIALPGGMVKAVAPELYQKAIDMFFGGVKTGVNNISNKVDPNTGTVSDVPKTTDGMYVDRTGMTWTERDTKDFQRTGIVPSSVTSRGRLPQGTTLVLPQGFDASNYWLDNATLAAYMNQVYPGQLSQYAALQYPQNNATQQYSVQPHYQSGGTNWVLIGGSVIGVLALLSLMKRK